VQVFFACPKGSVDEFSGYGRDMPHMPHVGCAILIFAMLTYFFRHTRSLTIRLSSRGAIITLSPLL
jgi:hypothetical protein